MRNINGASDYFLLKDEELKKIKKYIFKTKIFIDFISKHVKEENVINMQKIKGAAYMNGENHIEIQKERYSLITREIKENKKIEINIFEDNERIERGELIINFYCTNNEGKVIDIGENFIEFEKEIILDVSNKINHYKFDLKNIKIDFKIIR